jgi:type IV pilus assembly protein PilP
VKHCRPLLAIIGIAVLSLSACGGDGLDDIREFVKNAHADKKPKVEPLPELKVQETFAYSPEKLADPFTAVNLKPLPGDDATKAGGGSRPDPNRRKEPLEDYPLETLKMVGTLSRGNQVWAVIQAGDGTVHRAKTGEHLGQNFGMITRITDDKISIIELIQGNLGDWAEREANLSLAD